jgi:hypothetical protein
LLIIIRLESSDESTRTEGKDQFQEEKELESVQKQTGRRQRILASPLAKGELRMTKGIQLT